MKRIMILLALMMGYPSIGRADDQVFPKKGTLAVGGWVDFALPDSLSSFEKHANQMDQVYLQSYTLQPDAMPHPVPAATQQLKARAVAAARRNNVVVWLQVDNFSPATGQFEPKVVERLIHNGDLKKQHIKMLIDYALADGVNGIMIDYRGLQDGTKGIRNRGDVNGFMSDLRNACRVNKLYCGIRVAHKEYRDGNADEENAFDYPGLGGMVDQIIPVNENQNEDVLGPSSAPEWLDVNMAYSQTALKLSKVLISIRNEGYDWGVHRGRNLVTRQEFKNLAQKYNVAPRRDTNYSQELSIEYNDAGGTAHTAWIGDDRTLELQCDVAKKYQVYGVAIYRLGGEEESFWTILKKVTSTPASTANLLPAEVKPPPAKLRPIDMFTNDVGSTTSYAYPTGDEKSSRHGGSKFLIIYKQGKRWWDLQIESDTWAGGGLGCPTVDLTDYVVHGALQFYIRGFMGGEQFRVGFGTRKGLKDRLAQWGFGNDVKVTDYIKVTTEWQLVTIPLEDFKNTGETWSDRQGQTIYNLYRWNRVNYFTVAMNPPVSDPWYHLQFANVRIIPTYDVKAVAKEKESMQ